MIVVPDKFVFVHLPRCGGTFIADVIWKFFPSARQIGYHLPWTLLPSEYSQLPVLGAVRNPWEFYVSWYHHVWPRDAETPLISWVTDNGKHGFAGSTRNALNFAADNDRLDRLIELVPEEVDYNRKHIPNITKEALRKARGTGVGYFTFRFNHLFGNAKNISFCKQEALREDLINFFDRLSILSNGLSEYVLGSEKKNTAEYVHYSTYYTPELAELVKVRDRLLIEKFGYTFERSLATQSKI